MKSFINSSCLSPAIHNPPPFETLSTISADYYLKIYNYSEKDLIINNTISIIDNLEPYKIIEFTTNDKIYNYTIEIPDDNNKYYIVVNVITKERELLSYNSLIIEKDKEKEGEEKTKGFPLWALILIIILAILILIIIIWLIVRAVKKKNNVQIENLGESMIPLK